jgi:hypothetical protein
MIAKIYCLLSLKGRSADGQAPQAALRLIAQQKHLAGEGAVWTHRYIADAPYLAIEDDAFRCR